MMRHRIISISLVLALGYGGVYLGLTIAQTPDFGAALLAGGLVAALCLGGVALGRDDRQFMIRLFLLALSLRWLSGAVIYYKAFWNRIGPDAATYDYIGNDLARAWHGLLNPQAHWLLSHTNTGRSGWGMYYYVAAIYYAIGQNPFAIQLINSSLGAMTCVLVYKITRMIYQHPLGSSLAGSSLADSSLRVARLAAILTAVSPSMVMWSSQGLKEAPIMLCLCACAYLTLRLCRKIGIVDSVLLIVFLFCLYSLRHYVFYILFVAILASLLFAAKKFSPARALQGGLLVITLGVAFAYFGADKPTQDSLDLKRIQRIREWGNQASNSGFGGEANVTDPEAALAYLPLGVIYVLFAPFPWMIKNSVQLLILPEMIIWWLSAPFLFKGYWFAVRRRLRESFAICLFTVGLTLVYALFQSNFGTAHRQRAQIFIFFFIFISIGWELRREARQRRQAQATLLIPRFGQLRLDPTPMANGGHFR